MALRDYQQNAIDRVNASFTAGVQGCFLVLPTGGGKTIIFTDLIRQYVERGLRCVVVAHRQELIHQAGATIGRIDIPHGVIKAGPSTMPLAQVQVVSIDSMRNRVLPWSPDLIVLDEAHLCKADRYKNFLAKYPKAQRLLVSATPVRTDGSGFDDVAQALIIGATINDLINHPNGPYLVPPKVYTGGDITGLESIKMTAGDYNQGELETLMTGRQLVGDIVQHYLARAKGRKGVVFCVGINHSKITAQAFNEAGIVAEHIDGTMGDAERSGILNRLANGFTSIVTNASILCEGWDCPPVAYIGLARPTKSLALYIQQSGRGLRICPEIGKSDCIVIDHGNNVEEHGHLLDLRNWDLAGQGKDNKKKKPKPRHCKVCDAVIPQAANICPACGEDCTAIISIVTTESILTEVEAEITNPVILEYKRLLEIAASTGRKAGWAYYTLVDVFGGGVVKAQLSYSVSQRLQQRYYKPMNYFAG